MTRIALALATVGIIATAITLDQAVSAHFTAVSPYTYWRDVVPILDAQCGRCHTDGSVSGLSLMNYQSARGATWLIRQRLIRGHMPPWFAEGPFRSPTPMTARELDILMTWATGGAPEGRVTPPPVHDDNTWALGPPDLVIPIPSFSFTKDEDDRVQQVTLPSAKVAGRMIRAADLLPGTPALVRSAEIVARSGSREQVIGLWQPREFPAALPVNAGVEIRRGAELRVRIRYRRRYGSPASDRSQLGIYLAPRGAVPIRTIEVTADPARSSTRTIERAGRALAIRPMSGASGTGVQLTLIGKNGATRNLGRIEIQREWARRYIFDTPVPFEAGDRIEVSVIPATAQLWSGLTGEPIDADMPIRIALDVAQ